MFARGKGIDQTMQSIFGAGFHGGRSIGSHCAQTSRNLDCLPVSVQTRVRGKFFFESGIGTWVRQKIRPVPEETGLSKLAPEEGFEPPTGWLTATCSTAELLRIGCVAPPAASAVQTGKSPSANVPEFLVHGRQRSSATAAGYARSGGPGRNRTDVKGFAVLCITTLPPGPVPRPPARRAGENRRLAQRQPRHHTPTPHRAPSPAPFPPGGDI